MATGVAEPPEPSRPEAGSGTTMMRYYPRSLHLYRLITILSGPAHAMGLYIGISVALQLRQRPVSLVDALFWCWDAMIVLHLIVLLYNAWRLQRMDWPDRNPFLVAAIAVVYTLGNLITFVVTWLAILAVFPL